MHCLLIDDNPKTASQLESLLQSNNGITHVHKAVQPYLVRSLMACEHIEIIFIRVRLWDFRVLERLENMPVIVFLSGGKDKLTDKPGTTVPYRLREPYSKSDTDQLINKLSTERLIETPAYFFLRYEGRFHRIFFKDVEMVERTKMGYVRFWTSLNVVMLSGTLTQWLSKLPQGQFIRVSDTLILPLSQAKNLSSDEYVYRGRTIKLTYRFASAARKEMELQSNWIHWPSG